MNQSKSQTSNKLHYFGFIITVIGSLILFFTYYPTYESKPDKELTPGVTTLENADSLETTNPKYLEKYFDKWQ
jgi:hypothetical protein